MMDCVCTREYREQVATILDGWKANILRSLDEGATVTLHIHNSIAPDGPDLPGGMPSDFAYTGWTFGASVGDYPRRPLLASPDHVILTRDSMTIKPGGAQ